MERKSSVADVKKRPTRLDFSNTKPTSPSPPSALATARPIEDLESVSYPEGVLSPNTELNIGAKKGTFRHVVLSLCAQLLIHRYMQI